MIDEMKLLPDGSHMSFRMIRSLKREGVPSAPCLKRERERGGEVALW